MTKADLVEQVADAVGPQVTKKDCGLVVLHVALARARHPWWVLGWNPY